VRFRKQKSGAVVFSRGMADSLSGLDNLVAGLSVFTAPGMEKIMLNSMRTRAAAQPLLAAQAIYYCRIVEGVVATLFPEV
jgi:hypothetical protein